MLYRHIDVVRVIESAIPNYRFWLSDLSTDLCPKNGLTKWIIQLQAKVCSCFIFEISAYTSTLLLIFFPLILISSAIEGGRGKKQARPYTTNTIDCSQFIL